MALQFNYNKKIKENPQEFLKKRILIAYRCCRAFINNFPFSEKIKKDFLAECHFKLYREINPTSDGKTTFGINSHSQLLGFYLNCKHLFLECLEKWVKNEYIDSTIRRTQEDPVKALKENRKQLYEVRRLVLLNQNNEESSKHYQFVIQFLQNEVEYYSNILTQPPPTPKDVYTYKWLGNTGELDRLFTKMSGVFINGNTSKNDFIAIFSELKIIDIRNKIEWIESKTLLAYFIDKIRTEGKISVRTDVWAIAKVCFTDANGLKQSKNNYTVYSDKPRGHQTIDSLFENS